MKSRTVVLAIGLIFVCSIDTQVMPDEPPDNEDLTIEVQRLRAEVSTLQRQVDYLMIEIGYDASDIDALAQRVQHAEQVQARIQALFRAGGQGAQQLHLCNAELRLAQARLAFGKKDYDAAIQHLDAAVAARKMVQEVLESKFEAGTVTLDFLIAAQQSVTDAQLEKNRRQRKIQFLKSAR